MTNLRSNLHESKVEDIINIRLNLPNIEQYKQTLASKNIRRDVFPNAVGKRCSLARKDRNWRVLWKLYLRVNFSIVTLETYQVYQLNMKYKIYILITF